MKTLFKSLSKISCILEGCDVADVIGATLPLATNGSLRCVATKRILERIRQGEGIESMAADLWWLLIVACLAWYSTITVYVSVRGVADIRHMLKRLGSLRDERDQNQR